jgi:hypothetical protein
VLKLELGVGYYAWRFITVAGRLPNVADSGRNDCHGSLPHEEPPDTLPPPPPVDTTPPPPAPTITLSVKGERRVDGRVYNTLDWTRATGTDVQVYRNGPLLLSTPNDGHYVNSIAGAGTWKYRVCDVAGCSPEVSVTVN